MDPRVISAEVSQWYRAKLDPFKPHQLNVRELLRGPVLNLTSRVLQDAEEQDDEYQPSGRSISQDDEKKSSSVTGRDSQEKKGSYAARIISETPKNKSKQDVIYYGLERRDRARLDAFLDGLEIAVTSASERSPPSSPAIRPKNSPQDLLLPKAPKSKTTSVKKHVAKQKQTLSSSNPQSPSRDHTHNKRAPAMTSQPKKKFESSSPVLTSLNNRGKALLRSVSDSVSADTSSVRSQKQAQIREQELRIRLELYIRSLCRVRSLGQECVVAYEPDRAIKARCSIVVSAFISTVGCVDSLSPVLSKLLMTLTKELLAVEFIGEALLKVIRRLVNQYEHASSFASLAFLSTPETAAETRLTPMILKYIRYLQSDWKSHERNCVLERMLSQSLDGGMRKYYKTAEFKSIGHLLEVCHGFRNELNTIELSPTSGIVGESDLCNDPEAVSQATRDLQREVITINGQVQPIVGSRSELVNLLSQSINSRSLTAANAKSNVPSTVGKSESCPSLVQVGTPIIYEDETDNVSALGAEPSCKGQTGERKPRNRKASFHLSAVDLLTRRLLIAASRTGTGGDAYFIVRDLFGGDDVEVVPAKILPQHVRASRVGSIEIQLRLASVTIKCHGSFDIYPSGRCDCEPLIQLHTTTSETIFLQELRACDSGDCIEDDGSRSSGGTEKLVLQERQTNRTGRRVLSIRPALYEKVQVWNTPS